MHETLKGNIIKAAAMVPEDTSGPADQGRSHDGPALRAHRECERHDCEPRARIKSAAAGDAEKLATKAEIEKALAASFTACDHGFQMITAANANEAVTLFGQAHTRIGAMAFNNAHDYEHYGNIVTYTANQRDGAAVFGRQVESNQAPAADRNSSVNSCPPSNRTSSC